MWLFGRCVWRTLQPFKASTYDLRISGLEGIGIAARWGALFSLIPLITSSWSPDPGILFAFFASYGTGVRHRCAAADSSELHAVESVRQVVTGEAGAGAV
jgi:hypothetical protein